MRENNLPTFLCLFVTVGQLVAQIGPNVSISANVRVGPGARLISCIILDDVEIKVCHSMRINKLLQLICVCVCVCVFL